MRSPTRSATSERHQDGRLAFTDLGHLPLHTSCNRWISSTPLTADRAGGPPSTAHPLRPDRRRRRVGTRRRESAAGRAQGGERCLHRVWPPSRIPNCRWRPSRGCACTTAPWCTERHAAGISCSGWASVGVAARRVSPPALALGDASERSSEVGLLVASHADRHGRQPRGPASSSTNSIAVSSASRSLSSFSRAAISAPVRARGAGRGRQGCVLGAETQFIQRAADL